MYQKWFPFLLLNLAVSYTVLAHNHLPPPQDRSPSPRAIEKLPEPKVTIATDDKYRYILSNGIPDHQIGNFPSRNNPNALRPQDHRFRVPLNPQVRSGPLRVDMHLFGVAINGIPFDPGTAEWWQNNPQSGWNYEARGGGISLGLDASYGHVQPNGTYHYHGLPPSLIPYSNPQTHSPIIGWAADGFPIYGIFGYENPMDPTSRVVKMKPSYRIREGKRRSGLLGRYDGRFVQDYEYVRGLGDLDICNGRFGITPDYPQGTYYYFITDKFPYIPRCWRGTPDSTFLKLGPVQGR